MKHIGHIFVAVVALAAVCSAGAMTTDGTDISRYGVFDKQIER